MSPPHPHPHPSVPRKYLVAGCLGRLEHGINDVLSEISRLFLNPYYFISLKGFKVKKPSRILKVIFRNIFSGI